MHLCQPGLDRRGDRGGDKAEHEGCSSVRRSQTPRSPYSISSALQISPTVTICRLSSTTPLPPRYSAVRSNSALTSLSIRPSKYMDGHAVQNGGVIVDCGQLRLDEGQFPRALHSGRIVSRNHIHRHLRKSGVHPQGENAAHARFRRLPRRTFRIPSQSRTRNSRGAHEAVLRKCALWWRAI